jgi:hypothetical protein
MVLKINVEQVAYPLLASTHFTITLNVKHNNLMLSFDVWSSLFETLWITSKWGEGTNKVSKRYKIRVRLGMAFNIKLNR